MRNFGDAGGKHDGRADLFTWIEGLKFGRFHVMLLLLTGLPILFAGYCTQIVVFVLPPLLKEWGLSPVKAGTLVSWGFLGLMAGSVTIGALADRVGRKKMLMAALAVCCSLTGMSYFVTDFTHFCILRFFTGFGVGGVFPLAVTLVSEFSPSGIRARLLTVAIGGFTLGWVVAALLSMALIPAYGWRIVLAAGSLPLLFLPVLGRYLPESVRFLMGKGRRSAATIEVEGIGRMCCSLPPTMDEAVRGISHGSPHGRFADLFQTRYIRMTFLLSFTYLFSVLALYGLSSWLPTLLVKAGFSLARSFSYSLVQGIGSCLGGVCLGYLLDAVGRKQGLALTYFLGGLSVLFFGMVTSNASLYLAGVATGVFVLAAPTLLLVICGETYPTQIRSTGIGWAQAMGRIGSILGPIIGGALQSAGLSFRQFFLVFAVPCFVCMILVLFYRVKKRGESLETNERA